MSTMLRRWFCVLACAVLLCGCSTLPDSGRVQTRPPTDQETASQAPYFAPPGPTQGDSKDAIVRGFLLAMQANPPSTSVARSFLSNRAKATWKPNQGTVVYDAATVEDAGDQVSARLRGAYRLSPAGAWLDGTTASTTTVDMSLVREGGEWRIDDPPNVLAVPLSYFASLFVPFNLYYFDRTGTVLVPSKVYVPRGEETATNLVRGLLAGPPPTQRNVAVTAFPSRADLDFAVVVSDAGVAEVPLGPSVLRLPPADLNRIVVQLAWTLRQVPGINRLRISVGGAPVPLSEGRTDVSVGDGADYDPVIASQRNLLAISGGRMVRDVGGGGSPVAGPFGHAGFALRSLAWSPEVHQVAAVGENGRRVLVAPDRGARTPDRVRSVLDDGADLLRPAYDRFGGLWLVDDRPSGAVVHLVQAGRDRVLRVPGITGRRISAFTVTRDGTALVAALGTGSTPTLQVSNIERRPTGRVRRAAPARTLQVSGADLGRTVDIGQNDATTVAVLTDPSSGPDRIVFVELDGSPGPEGGQGTGAPEAVPGSLLSLVASPDPVLGLRAVSADGRIFTYTESGGWVRSSLTGVVAAAYAQ